MPPYVVLSEESMNHFDLFSVMSPGYLGVAHSAFTVMQDPYKPEFQLDRLKKATDSLELAIALARAGLGLTLAPRWAIIAMEKGLAALTVGDSGLWRTWVIAYPASMRLTSIHRAFLRICNEQLGAALSCTPAKDGLDTSASLERTGVA